MRMDISIQDGVMTISEYEDKVREATNQPGSEHRTRRC
jgi:hypothetical protein